MAVGCLLSLAGVAGASADEDPAEALYQSGAAAMRSHSYSEAIAAFERARDLRPDHLKTWLGLGIAHSALQDWDEAIKAYEQVLRIDPEHSRAHHNLANIRFRRSEYEAAASEYARALELDPSYILAAFHYGWTLRLLNRPEEAEQVFQHCLELSADDPRARNTSADCLFGLGSLRHRAGDYETSAKMMEQVLRTYPTHPEARYYLGMAYRQLGRLEEAKRELELHSKLLSAQRKRAPEFDVSEEP